MDPTKILHLGEKYSKKDLASVLDFPPIANVQGGYYNLRDTPFVFLFVTLEKEGVQESFHYNNFYEGEIFHWDSQNRQNIESAIIQAMVRGTKIPLLMARLKTREKNKTLPFVYCGRLEFQDYIKSSGFPVHIMFNSLDYLPTTTKKELREIYEWKPSKPTSGDNQPEPQEPRTRSYTRPTITERRGLVTSRVGQGYYRQLVIGKWKGKCAVTSCDLQEILIASHIVPWRDSTEEERLDPDNGILLSPVLDALFDKHLISFDEEGKILVSSKLDEQQCQSLNIKEELHLKMDEGMRPYLERHRTVFMTKLNQ